MSGVLYLYILCCYFQQIPLIYKAKVKHQWMKVRIQVLDYKLWSSFKMYEQYNFSSLTFLCFKTEYKSIGLTKNVNVERNQLYLHCSKIVIDSASGIDHQKENWTGSVYVSKSLTIICSLYRDGPVRSHWHTDCFVGIGGCCHYLPKTSNVSRQTPDRKYSDTETNVTTELQQYNTVWRKTCIHYSGYNKTRDDLSQYYSESFLKVFFLQ